MENHSGFTVEGDLKEGKAGSGWTGQGSNLIALVRHDETGILVGGLQRRWVDSGNVVMPKKEKIDLRD